MQVYVCSQRSQAICDLAPSLNVRGSTCSDLRDECLRLLCLLLFYSLANWVAFSFDVLEVLSLRLSRLICTFIEVVKREDAKRAIVPLEIKPT